jgi:tellurite resistance protein TerC
VPQVPTWLSLVVIGVTMLVTTGASLIKARRGPSTPGPAPQPAATGVGDGERTPR